MLMFCAHEMFLKEYEAAKAEEQHRERFIVDRSNRYNYRIVYT